MRYVLKNFSMRSQASATAACVMRHTAHAEPRSKRTGHRSQTARVGIGSRVTTHPHDREAV